VRLVDPRRFFNPCMNICDDEPYVLGGNTIKEGGDWIQRDLNAANIGVIQNIFARGVEADLSLISTLQDMNK
jgi:hypothetical protein